MPKTTPTLTFDGEAFIATGDPRTMRRMGFVLHDDYNEWRTKRPLVAAQLRAYADRKAENKLSRLFITHAPWLGRIPFPPGVEPYDFQLGAARFALSRNRSYLALDPGLGKTIVAALILNSLPTAWAVYFCPPFLTLNTQNEFRKWCPESENNVLIIPDSWLVDPLGEREETWHKIQIARSEARKVGKPFIAFIDEAHRFKNNQAQRTQSLFRILDEGFDKIVFMSGTPMPNRPMELYPVLSTFAPETIHFMSERQYGMYYCDGFYDGFGYNFRGAKNVEKLAKNVRSTFMLRLKKKGVLKELPPVRTEMIIIGEKVPKRLRGLDEKLLKEHGGAPLQKMKEDSEISRYRHMLGLSKVKDALSYLKEILDENQDESILVFAEHRLVIERLTKGLSKYKPLVITGAVDKDKRQGLVDVFQKNKEHRVFIGNIKACGVGFTLTKATRVVFVEWSWTPGDNDQARDRAHRIGQTDSVLEEYLVF